MKTLTADIEKNRQFQTTVVQTQLSEVIIPIREILALLSAVTAATAVILLSIWMAGMGFSPVVGAGTWGVAIIFLALAVDSRSAIALLQLSTGGALIVTAWLQNTVSPDYAVVSGVLVAAWIAVMVFKQLK